MQRTALLLILFCLGQVLPACAFELDRDYLYFRDANVPPFQKSREFFDMPNRPGRYEITLLSESIGPLTFRMVRVTGEQERTAAQRRSYRAGDHEFQVQFDNPTGNNDLIVEISNSNPVTTAKVSVYVVELDH